MKPDIELVAKWVEDVWDTIPEDMIRQSFLKRCISTSLDGEEDDAIFIDECVPEVRNAGDEESAGGESSNSVNDGGSDDDDGIYADDITEEQFHQLFGNADDDESEFEGF